MHIGVDRKERARQQTLQRRNVIPVQAQSRCEMKPALDTAFALARTVMIDKPLAPGAPQLRIFGARDQARILQRDHRLIIIAIERPGLNLTLAALAAMKQPMKRMKAVIAFGAKLAQMPF